jgi:hypothetical protein
MDGVVTPRDKPYFRMYVSGIIVEDEMEVERLGHADVDMFEEEG